MADGMKWNWKRSAVWVAAAAAGTLWGSRADAFQVTVRVENLSPANGTFLTPAWVGFHDGGFDLYDQGSPASAALERLAEDGNTGPLSGLFQSTTTAGVDGTIPSATGPFAPGSSATMTFSVDPVSNRFFSYASMVIPSNDAFIANGNPLAHALFDSSGNFIGADFIVLGSSVLDAGTEVNDEIPGNTAFFGQASPDTGTTENGVVAIHAGFLPVGSGGILASSQFAGADFLASGYQIARITVTPEPTTGVLILAATTLWGVARRRGAARR